MMNHFGFIVNTIMVHHNIDMTNHNEAQMKLRLPPDMRDKIAALAKENNRSMNAEIIARLQRTMLLPNEGEYDFFGTKEAAMMFIDEMEKRLPGIIRGELATAKIKDRAEEPVADAPPKRINRTRSPK